MNLSEEHKGEVIIFSEALIWSLFPIITILSYSSLSPITSLGWTTGFAAIFFAIMLTIKKRWSDIKNISALKDILLAVFFIGICYYSLMFIGIKNTSPGNVSIIALAEIFFSFLFFNIWKKEYINKKYIIGAILIVIGAVIILFPQGLSFRKGDIFILIATMFAPIGNSFQQRARKKISTEGILFIRNLIVFPFFFGAAYLLKETATFPEIKSSLLFLIINGIMLLGLSKILWIEAIHRISVTKAISVSSISPIFTLIFSYFILKEVPTSWQLLSFIPMFFGVILLTSKNKPLPIKSKAR